LGKPFECPNCGIRKELDWKTWETWRFNDETGEWEHDERWDEGTWICQGCGWELSLDDCEDLGLPW